ncbi:MAG: DMT family transporter [Flavobacteriaceae bacterium]|nr:DMT family transporter [Flavobacteriaceae bacterium]
MNTSKRIWPVLQINLAVLFISTSGVLGRTVSFLPQHTIFWRSILATIIIYLFCRFKGYRLSLGNRSTYAKIGMAGFLFGMHWVTYFYALYLSNVAIGILSVFTYPVITAFLEPIFLKKKLEGIHLLLGVLVLIGIYFLVPEFDMNNQYTQAILWGVVSAITYAIRNIMLKKQVSEFNGSVLMFYQLLVVSILLFPVLFDFEYSLLQQTNNWSSLLLLALVTTALGHSLLLASFRDFSITTASIISSTQPVYGILLAMVFLGEIPAFQTIIGGGLIVLAVMVESFRSIRKKS